MDTSWIELPNNHVDYINGVIEFKKLAKETLIEGRTRCPCKHCKVDKWLTLDEVEQHILFKGLNQPMKRAGCVLVKYLGSLAKNGTFCPIGAETWPHVNNIYKADIIRRVREKFVIPPGQIFDDAILMRVAKFWRHYKNSLKTSRFHPEKKTKEQIISNVPLGHTKDNWMRLVEFWYSDKSQKWSDIGKEARASQSHVHTTGSTSYANKRAEFVETKGKQPSHLEFFEFTHTKIGGGFVENTLSSQLLEVANSKVNELAATSSPSKSRTEIENDVFDKLMYETDKPKRPVGFGFGVKQSQVFGVHSILKQRGYGSATTTDNSTEIEIMRSKMLEMEKENQELRSNVEQSNARVDQSNQILLQALDAIRTGRVTNEFYESAQLALRTRNSQAGSGASGSRDRAGVDDRP